MAKRIKIPGRMESAEMGGVVTGAADIFDDEKGKKQSVINEEVDTELGRLDADKQDNLTFDAEPTENSENPVTSGGVYAADLLLSQAIEAILLLIPSAASALNQLADKAFVNSSISTDTATFRGTYNVVSDLGLAYNATHAQIEAALLTHVATADNNDYAFVQIPVSGTSQDIAVTERYKFNGTAWAYEYDLNNSGFTAAQWAAINSTITAALVGKLSALPTAAVLQTLLDAKQNNLIFDEVPTAGSSNPVKSGGVKSALNTLDAAKQDKLTFDTTPINSSVNPVTSGGVYTAIDVVQTALYALTGRVTVNENNISANADAIALLQDLYEALTQSALVVVDTTDTWPVANPEEKVIYRVVDRVNTPPQFYSDYMWNGTAMVLMATYDNAIDDKPTVGSNNLAKSRGIASAIKNEVSGICSFSFGANRFNKKIFTGYFTADGSIDMSIDGFYHSDYIPIKAGETLYSSFNGGDVPRICLYDLNLNFISSVIANTQQITASQDGYARFSMWCNNSTPEDWYMISDVNVKDLMSTTDPRYKDYDPFSAYINNEIERSEASGIIRENLKFLVNGSINLLNTKASRPGYYENVVGYHSPNNDFRTSEKIYLSQGETITWNFGVSHDLYTIVRNLNNSIIDGFDSTVHTYTAVEDCTIEISYYVWRNEPETTFMVVKGPTIPSHFIPYNSLFKHQYSGTIKKVLWLGTSIPAGCTYPNIACINNGFEVINKAIGASFVIFDNTIPSTIYGHSGFGLSGSSAEKEALWRPKVEDHTITEEMLDSFKAASYDVCITPYLNDVDTIVIDHGYNDRYDLENVMNLGYDNIDWESRDRSTFIGAMNYILDVIYSAKPQMRVIIGGYFQDNMNAYGSAKAICTIQEWFANYRDLPILKVWEYAGFSGRYVPNSNNYLSSFNTTYGTSYEKLLPDQNGNIMFFQVACPDGVHPYTDQTGKSDEILNGIYTKLLNCLLV